MRAIRFPGPPTKAPTRRQLALFRRWVAYLTDSKLDQAEVYKRAAEYAGRKEEVPT